MSYHVEGEGPVFVMVPGLDGTALLFYRQIPELARSFRVVTFPLPDDAACTMESLVSDLARLVDALGDDEVFLMGESFGGALSLSFALAHPAKLRGLVILNSFARVRQRFQLAVGPTLLRLVPWGAMAIARRFTESKLHTSHTSADDLQTFHELSRTIGKTGYLRRLEILRTYDIRDRLSEIETPTLFLAADQDRLVAAVDEAELMAARMPDAAVQVLEGYGHICLINHDFDLLGTIRPWVEARGVLLAT